MLTNWLERTELLLGNEKVLKLKQAHVLVAGLGGVGSYVAEQLVRSGIGRLTIVDGDVVQSSNRNRQLPALVSTLGQRKATVMATRLLDINPELDLTVVDQFMMGKDFETLLEQPFDYVVDAIDSLSPKVFLIVHTLHRNYRLISSMGAGGKLDPSLVHITDISKTYNCKLSRMVRKRLGKFGVKKGFPVVFSSEMVDPEAVVFTENERNKKTTTGTISYLPAIFGLYAASHVIREIIS